MPLIFWLILLFGLLFFIRKLRHRRRIVKLLKSVPCGSTLPIVGHAFRYKGPAEILNAFQEAIEVLGHVFRVTGFWKEAVFLSDPHYVELVLGQTKILHKSEEYNKLQSWLGTGLIIAGPEKWKQMRKIITPTFHFQILEDFVDIFDSCSDVLVSKLKGQVGANSVDITDYVTLCTLDVICETAMGTKVNAQLNSDSKYISCVKEMVRIFTDRAFSAKTFDSIFYLSRDYWLQRKALQVLHGYTKSVISRRRKEMDGRTDDATVGKKRLAFLDLLLQSTIDGRPMTDEEIRQEVDTFMFAGHDTTSSAINSVLYCLAFHPDIQDKVFKEVKKVFGNDRTKHLTYDDLQNMRYLEMVIKEALRLYPPIPLFARIAHEDIQIGDFMIPEGVNVGIYVYGLHRNPAIYPNPEKFDPERFTLENQNLRKPFDYVPFSAGPRNCVGQRFAMLEMKCVVSKMLRSFEVLPVRDFRPLWVIAIVLKSINGIHIRLRERGRKTE